MCICIVLNDHCIFIYGLYRDILLLNGFYDLGKSLHGACLVGQVMEKYHRLFELIKIAQRILHDLLRRKHRVGGISGNDIPVKIGDAAFVEHLYEIAPGKR